MQMKYLTEKERNELQLSPQKLRGAIETLKVGQSLLILREDARAKDGPKDIVRSIRQKTQWQLELTKLLDGSGWVVDRVK